EPAPTSAQPCVAGAATSGSPAEPQLHPLAALERARRAPTPALPLPTVPTSERCAIGSQRTGTADRWRVHERDHPAARSVARFETAACAAGPPATRYQQPA